MTWEVTAEDIDRIAIGGGILGAGGGGNPRIGMLDALRHLEQGWRLQVAGLDELPDDALVVPVGGMGAPTVGLEKMRRGDEPAVAVRAVEDYLGVRVAATVPIEVGGGNSLAPMVGAGRLGLPMVDADGMGRAFPEWDMISYYFDGTAPAFSVMVDCRHRKVIIENASTSKEVETLARAMCVQLGGSVLVADAPLTMARLRSTCIPATLSQALRLGTAVREAQRGGGDPVAAIVGESGGRLLFKGRVTDVERRVERGYNFGRIALLGTDQWQDAEVTIDLQNEFLIMRVDGVPVLTVPDIITMVDSERGMPITTEVVRYGLRVAVLGIPAARQLKTEQALRWVGPRAFGYDLDFVPLDIGSQVV